MNDHRAQRACLTAALRATGVGLLAATAATVGRGLLGLVAPDMAPYPLIFPAVLLAALAEGAGSGLVAAAAGLTAAQYLFVDEPYGFEIDNLAHGLGLATAAASSLLLVWLLARYRNVMLSRAHEREELMRTQLQLFEQSHGFMYVLRGPEYRYEYANPAYLRLIGKEKEDVLGKPLLEVIPDLEPIYRDSLDKVRRTGEVSVGRGVPRTAQIGGVKKTLYIDFVYQPMLSEDGSVDAVFAEGYDVTDKVEAEQRLRFLMHEVDHRANNLLAVVLSIVKLSRGKTPQERERNIVGRIDALARTHQLLSAARWRGADLQRLIEEGLLPYTLGQPKRSCLQGPPVDLSPEEAQALAIAIYELATNAAKYGALSTPAGQIEVTWDSDNSGARHIRWQENGGPRVTAPTRKGFGANVLERTLRGVGGRTRLVWRPEGLVCEFDLPPRQSET